MITALATPRPSAREVFTTASVNTALPHWLRVWAWLLANLNEHGHAPARYGQIRTEVGLPSARAVSDAIADLRVRDLVDQSSSARCIALPGLALNRCPVDHPEVPDVQG